MVHFLYMDLFADITRRSDDDDPWKKDFKKTRLPQREITELRENYLRIKKNMDDIDDHLKRVDRQIRDSSNPDTTTLFEEEQQEFLKQRTILVAQKREIEAHLVRLGIDPNSIVY